VVTVTGGQIRGMAAPDGGAAFKGIPYARPPVGTLRWREPQPVAAWTGVRDATAFSAACTQLSEGWNMRYVPSSAEDCLYLNVAAPVWPPTAKVPVMVGFTADRTRPVPEKPLDSISARWCGAAWCW